MEHLTLTCGECNGLSKVSQLTGQTNFRCPHCQAVIALPANTKPAAANPSLPIIHDSNGKTQQVDLETDSIVIKTDDRKKGSKPTPEPAEIIEESFVISLGDEQITLQKKAKTVPYRGSLRQVRELSREERSIRRRNRSLVLGAFCVLVLILTAAYLIKAG